MADHGIAYRSGYKYQLAEDYSLKISIKPGTDIDTAFIALDAQGNLRVKSGYAWDGTSGPVVDTPFNLRASLVHDALYQLMREKSLSAKEHKEKADKLFKKLVKEDGVPAPVAQVYYEALKKLGKPATKPENAKAVKHAP
ncbi:DUF1353 domain-containing protein [Marinobacterium rhizophilum]|uniref:DUF1353 domain-containing protein n=1 Tax=Marinobacterium rhizophilum TaxID=420402 RepID=A0ABY5HDH8_9GAMM|nr:DUF1353 domain-containing protein [Marinobacterium rhizophilum]UTW10253.1 DUF1353 domain-containing protein [Marinobacterium rhizophilum]